MEGSSVNKPSRLKCGRFVKKSILDRHEKCVNGKEKLKRNKEETAEMMDVDIDKECPFEGRRIFSWRVIWEELYCYNCRRGLSLRSVESEKVCGLAYIWTVRCPDCLMARDVHSDSQYLCQKTHHMRHTVNAKFAFASVDSGIGATQLNTILSAVDIPPVSHTTLQAAEMDISPIIQEVAHESCKAALEEERELSIKEPVICSINEYETPKTSNDSVPIAVSYDHAWTTRGSGRSYDSLAGHGSAIGVKSRKVLAFTATTRKCFKCEAGDTVHTCRGVFKGSAKAMEPAAAVKMLSSQNPHLSEANVKVAVLVGDDDASTISNLRNALDHPIDKWSDLNHAEKTLSTDLYTLARTKRYKILTSEVIAYFKKCFGFALAQNRNDVEGTKTAIKNIVPHAFGDHDGCSEVWCRFMTEHANVRYSSLPNGAPLSDGSLRDDLNRVFSKFVSSAPKLAPGGSTQANESFNMMVTSKTPKTRFYGGTFSYPTRVAAAVSQKNIGTRYASETFTKMSVSPGSYTKRFRERRDHWRAIRGAFKSSRNAKLRRNMLAKQRRRRGAGLERKEGISYQTGMGYNDGQNVSTQVLATSVVVRKEDAPADSAVVFFDIETSGLARSDEILQLAATVAYSGPGTSCTTFSKYAYPTRGISKEAGQVTGLSFRDGELYLRGILLKNCQPLRIVLGEFVQFLRNIQKSVVLIGHNARIFDFPRVLLAMRSAGLEDEFLEIVRGLGDTLKLFKRDAQLTNEPSLKQEVLAEKYLPGWNSDSHEALSDCLTLERLCQHFQYDVRKLVDLSEPTWKILEAENVIALRNALQPSLKPLEGIVSKGMIKKLAENSLTLNILKAAFEDNQQDGIRNLLSENVGGRPRVTKCKKIIDSIVEFFQKQDNPDDPDDPEV